MGVLKASVRRAAQVSAAVLVALAALWCGTHCVRDGASGGDTGWYTPVENDFRREYERDTANQKLQTWSQYWSWVTTFYNGNALSTGWSSQARSSAAIVKSPKRRNELIFLANDLGTQISMEWAKAGGVGRISTADLIRWSPTLIAARRAEDGSGERLREAVLKVRAEVARKLGLAAPSADARGLGVKRQT
jgi:hypothetical protein